MYTIGKEFTFEAAHSLPMLPEGHKCRNTHGHSYRVRIVVTSDQLNEHGFVIDFGDFDRFGDFIKKHFDHTNLNDIFDPTPTTAENIARRLYDVAVGFYGDIVVEVAVSETAKTVAAYSEGQP